MLQGGCEVFLDDAAAVDAAAAAGAAPAPVAVFAPGHSFGDQALLSNVPRNASIRARQDCLFAVLDAPGYARYRQSIVLVNPTMGLFQEDAKAHSSVLQS